MQSSSVDVAHLHAAWPLAAPELRDELVAAYSDTTRGYHDVRHLAEVLERVAVLEESGETFELTPVLLAAWFHDSVYDGERDAEVRSASWAEHALPGLVDADTVAEVARLVRLTETHRPAEEDANGCVLSDADLGILAASADRYAEYVAAVRSEYAHLDDDTFNGGRTLVLTDLLSKPRLFHTTYAHHAWEDGARANASAEVEQLRRGSGARAAASQPGDDQGSH